LIYHTMNKTFADCFSVKSLSVLALSLGLAGCGNGSWWSKDDEPTLEVEHIRKAIPSRVNQREPWAQDIYDITAQLGNPQTKENVCTRVAVVDQESNFVADPTVPRLGERPVKEGQDRLEGKFRGTLAQAIGGTVAGSFQGVLKNRPGPEDNYVSQM